MKGRRVLFINHLASRCGVYQFGINVCAALAASKVFDFVYLECANAQALQEAVRIQQPAAIIYNHTPITMPWLKPWITRRVPFPQIGVIHEVSQERANRADSLLFDFHIAPDPTLLLLNPNVFKTGRVLPPCPLVSPEPDKLTIASFGFGTRGKGFTDIVEKVQQEFDVAVLRFNIPFSTFADPDGTCARKIAEDCRRLVHKPQITLDITHDFLQQDELLGFLSGSNLTAFFYEENKQRGISSAIDLALAVKRPIAVTRSNMFRHVLSARPSICIDDASLRTILSYRLDPLAPFREEWTCENICWDYERICLAAIDRFRRSNFVSTLTGSLVRRIRRRLIPSTTNALNSINGDKLMLASYANHGPSGEARPGVAVGSVVNEIKLNRILDQGARDAYADVIKLLFELCPEEMARKIPTANIQQAFVFETVRNIAIRKSKLSILCVGCYEDTAYLALQRLGMEVVGIDPVLNYDLRVFMTKPGVAKDSYDIIFATSVLEHVEDDESFVAAIATLLKPDGHFIATCDFNDTYRPGDRIPGVDFRFYTESDLRKRLPSKMPACQLLGEPDWEVAAPDFWFEGLNYTFATFVVKKTNLDN